MVRMPCAHAATRHATCLPVEKREQVQDTQARQEMQVNLGHQLALAN